MPENDDIPSDLRPTQAGQEPPVEIQEIVSPVQPKQKRYSMGDFVFLGLLLIAVGILGYKVSTSPYGIRFHVPIAEAPENNNTGLTMPVATLEPTQTPGVPVQTPTVMTGEQLPIPRTSSTSTNEPSAVGLVPKPRIAGESVVTPAYTYTSTHGFSVRVPAGHKALVAQTGEVIIQNAQHKVVAQIAIVPQFFSSFADVEKQLSLSPVVSNIHTGTVNMYPAVLYIVNGTAQGAAVFRGSELFYITDYSGKVFQTFMVR